MPPCEIAITKSTFCARSCGQELLRRFDQPFRIDLAFEVALVPLHDRRRREADQADPDRRIDRVASRVVHVQRAFDDCGRRIDRLVVARAEHVGQHQWIVRPLAIPLRDAVDVHRPIGDLGEKRQTVIEFVVADRAAVVAERIHRAIYRQFLVAADRLHQRLIVRQRGALDRVAGIEQHGIRELRACLLDQGRHALETERLVLGEFVVVVAQDVRMDVGRFEDRQLRARTVRDRRRMSRRHAGARGEEDCERGGQAKAGKCRGHGVCHGAFVME